MALGLGRGLGVGLLGKKPQEPPTFQFQLSEQMLMNELPAEAWNEFIAVFDSVQSNFEYKNAKEFDSVEESLEEIDNESTNALLGSLTSVAHQIDSGVELIEYYKNELKLAQNDLTNSSHIRILPTPFIKRYVARIHNNAENLSQALKDFECRLHSNTERDPHEIMQDFFKKQYEAIIRCYSRIARIQTKSDEVRTSLLQKIRNNQSCSSSLSMSNEVYTKENVAQSIRTSFSQYQAEMRKKNDKRNQNSDLFGNSTVTLPNKVGGLGLGSGLGSSFGASRFGSNASTPVAPISVKNSTRPTSSAPPPTPRGTANKNPFS